MHLNNRPAHHSLPAVTFVFQCRAHLVYDADYNVVATTDAASQQYINLSAHANGRVVVSSSSLATVGRRSKLTGDANRGRKKLLSPEQSKSHGMGKSSFHGRYSKVTHPMQRRSAVVRCADLPDPVETDGVDDHEAEPSLR